MPLDWNDHLPPTSRSAPHGPWFHPRPQLDVALDEQRRSNHEKLLGEILVDQQFCSEEQVAEALAEADGIPFARISPRLADPQVVAILPQEFLLSNGVMPLFVVENTLTLAMAEPSNLFLVEQIERRTGHSVQVVAATLGDIRSTLEAYLHEEKVFVVDRASSRGTDGSMKLLDAFPSRRDESIATEPAVNKLVDYCIYNAVNESAAEVHIEPGDEEFRIRYRIDGRLFEKLRPPARLHANLVSGIKQLAGLDANERRLPQEGQLRVESASAHSRSTSAPFPAGSARRWCCVLPTRIARRSSWKNWASRMRC